MMFLLVFFGLSVLFSIDIVKKKKEMKDYTRKWKAILFSWVEIISIVKISNLPKTIYGFTANPIKVFHRNRTKKS